jgi:hypothetical protein
MATAVLYVEKAEMCEDCGREWPARFGQHNCNLRRRHVHKNSLIIEPRTPLREAVELLTERHEREICRSAEYADNAGEEPPYREALKDIDAAIGALKAARREMQALAGHRHRWNSDDYCTICGADGRA